MPDNRLILVEILTDASCKILTIILYWGRDLLRGRITLHCREWKIKFSFFFHQIRFQFNHFIHLSRNYLSRPGLRFSFGSLYGFVVGPRIKNKFYFDYTFFDGYKSNSNAYYSAKQRSGSTIMGFPFKSRHVPKKGP